MTITVAIPRNVSGKADLRGEARSQISVYCCRTCSRDRQSRPLCASGLGGLARCFRASCTCFGDTSYAPFENHPSDARREPSALEGRLLEILYCDPKASRAFLRILSTEGRVVRLSGTL